MQELAQKTAEVVKLDKGFPLIRIDDGTKTRAEFNSSLSKKHVAVAIGDQVRVTLPLSADSPLSNADDVINGNYTPKTYNLKPKTSTGDGPCIIEEILPKRTALVRNDPVNRRKPQVLAANFDHIAICVAANQLNFNHLARMLVIACNSDVPVTLVFTKCDLEEPNLCEVAELLEGLPVRVLQSSVAAHSRHSEFLEEKRRIYDQVADGVRFNLTLRPLDTGSFDSHSVLAQDNVWGDGPSLTTTTVLLGKSGVGKSTLINALAGKTVCKQGEVREFDSKGRHTTVSREVIETEKFGRIVDMPGLRSLGLINCERGLHTVFSNIFEPAQNCKFRDCKHAGEPGCSVAGNVSEQLLNAWRELSSENQANSGR